ncbi:VWA domain-containing protein [Pseudokineococcus lusitanus]|uniref:Ca-activated chloride channel family protein n=1 Tax=Pseudokineococcus lusitanus TaxID=763993 RepID=A0A3N1HJZ8_9ACTN|nr:VWA domain-containing protein [Pseudokineococcus lusitanus]ROP42858.1 Ca-activated chloride channel family protein [Pseudokineococcus lusitanus]
MSAGDPGLLGGLVTGFLAPARLWLLLLVPALAAGHVLSARRRRAAALRFSAVPVLRAVAPRRGGWRRAVVPVLLLAGVAAAVVGVARPVGQVEVPRERATVVLAVDVSISMRATDVQPDRLTAAQESARRFVAGLPPRFNVGLVAFAGSGQVLVPPTTDRSLVARGIDGLELTSYTGIGEGLYTALSAVQQAPPDPDDPDAPVPAAVVLLSDGETTVGRTNEDAAAAAVEAGVPVSTIAFGTPGGIIVQDGVPTPVPVNEAELAAIAGATGGQAYEAESAGELDAVYADIGSSIGTVLEEEETTARWTALALALVVAAAVGSLLRSGRLSS